MPLLSCKWLSQALEARHRRSPSRAKARVRIWSGHSLLFRRRPRCSSQRPYTLIPWYVRPWTISSTTVLTSSKDFGFLSTSVHQEVLGNFTQNLNCSVTDTSCLNSLSLDTIMSAQNNLLNAAANNELDPAAGASEPIRPVQDGQLITNPLDLTASFPKQSKPIIVSTVRNEAGPTIYGGFPTSVGTSLYEQVVQFTFGNPRTSRILNTAVYAVSPAVNGVDPDQRPQLEVLGTDQIWRCATWTFARNWVGAGGKAYVGEYLVGATYPGNDEVPFCTASGSVCHQDDIEILVRPSA